MRDLIGREPQPALDFATPTRLEMLGARDAMRAMPVLKQGLFMQEIFGFAFPATLAFGVGIPKQSRRPNPTMLVH